VLFCWRDGRPPHPDTITRRFKKLAAVAGLPEIDLHDVRHSYATAGAQLRRQDRLDRSAHWAPRGIPWARPPGPPRVIMSLIE